MGTRYTQCAFYFLVSFEEREITLIKIHYVGGDNSQRGSMGFDSQVYDRGHACM